MHFPEASPRRDIDTTPNPRTLEGQFDIALKEHINLIDPETSRGKVTSTVEVEPVSPEGIELPGTVYEVLVEDPYVAVDPKSYQTVNSHIHDMEEAMRADSGFDVMNGGRRTEATSRDRQNKFTNLWLQNPVLKSLQIWRDLVPSAPALSYLTNPNVGTDVTNAAGETAIMTTETAAHLRFVDDAIGIRDRGVAFEQMGIDHLAKFKRGAKVKWLSLASGTAEPSILAAKRANEVDGVDVELTVADIDKRALKFVKGNAEKIGFKGKINTVFQNIIVPTIAEDLEKSTGEESQYDVVEAMGFEEYLPQDGDELEAYMGKNLPQASEFTKNAWDMVKPGGILMSGNMVINREQLDFVFGIVDWPIINARSEESIMRVYKEAGILDDPRAKIEMFRVKDATSGTHVYNIVKVTKQLPEGKLRRLARFCFGALKSNK